MNIKVSPLNKGTLVELSGPLDESAGQKLADLHNNVGNEVTFNFAKIIYINSLGIRSWVNFLRHIQEGRRITFEECTSDIVMQMNMMTVFKGSAQVKSFYGDYTCHSCDNEESICFEVKRNRDLEKEIRNQSCKKCQSTLTLDEDEENYLVFLED